MLKIEKIVDEIHSEKYTMKHLENVQAIDFETIVIVGSGSINRTIEDIIKEYRYHIYEKREFTIIDDEVYRNRDIDRKQYEFWKEFGDGIGYQKFREWIYPSKKVMEIKIESDEFYLRNMYQQWKKEEEKTESDKNNAHVKVKDVIEELQKFDPNLIIGFTDHEYGGFDTIRKYQWDPEDEDEDYSMLPKIKTIYDCPDCNRGCCSHCDGREIFKKKFLVL